MSLILKKLLNLFLLLSAIESVKSQCSIDIKTDLNKTEPLFLKYVGNQYKFMVPKSGSKLTWKQGETSLVICTGSKSKNNPNSFATEATKSSATLFCSSGKNFRVNDATYHINHFTECKYQINGDIQNTNTLCGNNAGILLNIGFQLNDGRGFVNYLDVCYNKSKASPVYTKHKIYGAAIKGAMKSSTRPSNFKTAEVPSRVSPADAFTKAKQMKRFETILGSEASKYFEGGAFLARGHLSPDADGIFTSWQTATYYYVNVVPQWQSINNGNWKVIESAVRAKAAVLEDDVVVYTGGHGVLKLNNKKITLDPKGLEVPLWSWKIIKVESSNSGIAFATYNNPFVTSDPTPLCRDICQEHNWHFSNRKIYEKGFTICCSVNDLIAVVPGIPTEARVGNILRK